MSIGPSAGILGSAAGAPLAQTKGSETGQTRDAAAQQRQLFHVEKAEAAAGIGQTTADEQSSERDADGRRLWEADADAEQAEAEAPRQTPDPTGHSGRQLDLFG